VAVSVTTAAEAKVPEQTEPQLTPDGLLVTVPLPLPVLLTSKVFVILDSGAKFATINWAATIDTVHGAVPVQSPLQPMKPDPEAGVAVNVTEVP